MPENTEEWWKSGVFGFLLRAVIAVAFSIAFYLQGAHPLVASLPVVLFALYALGTWWLWRNEEPTGRR